MRDLLQDVYLWYRELADPDPALFPSPELYLEAVRFRRLDRSFSYISTKVSDEAYFERSQFVGFGYSSMVVGDRLLVTEVFPRGAADEGGWRRGDEVVAINGVPMARLLADGELDRALGGREEGVEASFTVARAGETPRVTVLRKRVVTIPTVSAVSVFEHGGSRIGHLVLRNFVHASVEALDAAFDGFSRAAVSDVVIDVRYNGGGLVSVAQHLAGLVGGSRTAHQRFVEFEHSDRLRPRDRWLRFPTPPHALGLSRVVIITSRASASASEVLINALRPFVTVITVGDRTFGKPVGQYAVEFCDKVLHPVAFHVRNAVGQGDFFEGIPADCPVADDLDHALGDRREASLAEALAYLEHGACGGGTGPASPVSIGQAQRFDGATALSSTAHRLQPDGWQILINAW